MTIKDRETILTKSAVETIKWRQSKLKILKTKNNQNWRNLNQKQFKYKKIKCCAGCFTIMDTKVFSHSSYFEAFHVSKKIY